MLVLKIKGRNDDRPIGEVMRSLFMWLAAKKLEKFHAFRMKDNLTQIKFLDFTIFTYSMFFQHQVKGKAYNVIDFFFSLIYSLKRSAGISRWRP